MTTDNPISRRDLMTAAAAGAVLATTRAAAQPRSDELTKLSIDEASRRIAARELSPVDLTRAYLERMRVLIDAPIDMVSTAEESRKPLRTDLCLPADGSQ